MALSERSENDKIEVVGQYKAVQVRRADIVERDGVEICLLYTSPSPRDQRGSRMPSSA